VDNLKKFFESLSIHLHEPARAFSDDLYAQASFSDLRGKDSGIQISTLHFIGHPFQILPGYLRSIVSLSNFCDTVQKFW
jgi:hypothetical protein